MPDHFRRLFAYDEWANREVIESLCAASSPPARSRTLIAHIISAERLWLERIRRQAQPFPVWPDFSMEECESEAATAAQLWRSYLTELSEATLAETVAYNNTTGQNWASRIDDIMMHVIMHSAYHRGQIAADVRASGQTPPYTDFIQAVRTGLVE